MKALTILLSGMLIGLYSGNGFAAHHTNLVSCEKWLSLDTKCTASIGQKESVQPHHSRFNISYNFTCDSGATAGKPSPLRIVVHTEDGQTVNTTLNYKTQSSFTVDGYGPIEFLNDHPGNFSGKKFNDGCGLDINITAQKSPRTIVEENGYLDKIEQFVSSSEGELDDHFKLMVQYKSDIFAEQKNKSAMACVIKRYEDDLLYEEVLVDMKFAYSLSFKEDYEAESCDQGEQVAEIMNNCDVDDLSRTCVYKSAYFKSKAKIESIKSIASSYLSDSKAQSFHSRLQNLVNRIDSKS